MIDLSASTAYEMNYVQEKIHLNIYKSHSEYLYLLSTYTLKRFH